ncbi:hypothetical protein, partial [Rhodococcus jostii]|uniref:hypothetical protein n=1 Tax=Rhodococcus jostii TaxID=132919 RepID=UPI003624D929
EHTSELTWTKGAPLLPNGSKSTQQDTPMGWNPYTWGRICYRGSWWNLPRNVYAASDAIDFVPINADDLAMRTWRSGPAASGAVNANYTYLPLIKTPGDSGC